METLLTVPQMVECEQRSDRTAVSLKALMDNAADGLFKEAMRAAHERSCALSRACDSFCIVVGKGNNGGDGLVCARLLYEAGQRVSVVLAAGEAATPLAKSAYSALPPQIPVHGFPSDGCTQAIAGCDILIDCIFGTGFKGALREDAVPLFRLQNASPAYKIACDIPSGCDANSGLCDKDCFKADLTVTFHRKKIGSALEPTRSACGKTVVCDIGIPAECEKGLYPVTEPCGAEITALLPSRPADGHKGSFGRVLCICGSDRYIGAAAMSVNAALRSGAGIVTLASSRAVVSALAGSIFECTYLPFDINDPSALLDVTDTYDAVLIGCGLGQSADSRALVREVLSRVKAPAVVDADGLNCLAGDMDVLSSRKGQTLLTPHIGELARLCGVSVAESAAKRLELARTLCDKYGVTVAAKSAGTLIVTADGTRLCCRGNTALSKGGSGDMLAGMAASLIAQGCSTADAALLASYALGITAERLSERLSPRGILARDILSELPAALRQMELT